MTTGTQWVDFRGGWALASAMTYSDAGCTSPTGFPAFYVAYAPSGWSALALCTEAFPSVASTPGRNPTSDVWACAPVG